MGQPAYVDYAQRICGSAAQPAQQPVQPELGLDSDSGTPPHRCGMALVPGSTVAHWHRPRAQPCANPSSPRALD